MRLRSNRRKTRSLTKALLHKLYVEEELSINSCGERVGLSGNTVYRHLKKYGINIRGTRIASSEDIIKLYVHQELSLRDTAKILGVDRVSISGRLRRLGIDRRPGGGVISDQSILHKAPELKGNIRAYQREYVKERRKRDPQYALSSRMSVMIRRRLVEGKQGRSWKSLVPYTLEALRHHLEKTMPKGYSWDDFLSGALHIDHRTPVRAFNFTSADDHDFHRCWALKNLRFLPAFENMSKGGQLEKPFQPSLF